MKIETLKVTPSMAKKWLEKNNRNRPVKAVRVDRLSVDIINGNWVENTGESIKISKDGSILDGQHRLMAVVKSNLPINVLVATELNDEVFSVIDTGIKRTGGDVMHVLGVKNSTQASAIISRYLTIKSGGRGRSLKGSVLTPNNQKIVKEFNKNPSLWNGIVDNSITWYRKVNKVISPAFIGGWFAKLREIDQEDAFQFFEELCKGEMVTNLTIKVLRDQFIAEKVEKITMSDEKRTAFIIKAWNCYRTKKVLQQLRYAPESDNEIQPK